MGNANEITVQVVDNGRRAEVHIPAGFDRAYLTPEILAACASDAHVQITADVQRRIAGIIAAFKAGGTGDLTADLALAVEPVHGIDGLWAWEKGFDPGAGRNADGAEGAAASTDHYASQIISVTAGKVIAHAKPATNGADGRDVTGAVIAARRGKAPALRPGTGVEVRTDGSIVAACEGVIRVVHGIASVSPVLEIKGCVDFSTGHVEFKGDVVVGDAVRDGFQVRAAGGITVHGPVEGAVLACLGNLNCPRGIASARRAEIVAEGDADVAFMRNTNGIFNGNLKCRGEIESSDVVIGGSLECDSGRVIGGTLSLTGAARIGAVGSPDWTPTVVRMGDLPLVAMELARLTREAAEMQRNITAKEEMMRQLQCYGGGKSAQAREQLTLLQYEVSELTRAAAEHGTRRAQLREAMTKGRKAAGVHVERVVYPRVRIQHGETAFEFAGEVKGPLQFMIDERGTILIRVSAQAPRPVSEIAKTVRAQLPKCA